MKLYGITLDCINRHYDVTGNISPNPYVYNHTQHTWNDLKSALHYAPIKKSGWQQEGDDWKYYNVDNGLPVHNDWAQVYVK